MILESQSFTVKVWIAALLTTTLVLAAGCAGPKEQKSESSDSKADVPPYVWIVSPGDGAENLDKNVAFEGKSVATKNHKVNYEWDFGDGETITDQNPKHTYAAHGGYVVKLQAIDEVTQQKGNVAMAAICVGQPCPTVDTWTALGIFATLDAVGPEAFAHWAISEKPASFFTTPGGSSPSTTELGALVQSIYSKLAPLKSDTTEQAKRALIDELKDSVAGDQKSLKFIGFFWGASKGIKVEQMQEHTLVAAYLTLLLKDFPANYSSVKSLCAKLRYEGVPPTMAEKCALDSTLAESVISAYRPISEWVRSLLDAPRLKEFTSWLGAGAPWPGEHNPHSDSEDPILEPQLLEPLQPLANQIDANPEIYQLAVDSWALDDPVSFDEFLGVIENYRTLTQQYSDVKQAKTDTKMFAPQISDALAKIQKMLEQRFQKALKAAHVEQ